MGSFQILGGMILRVGAIGLTILLAIILCALIVAAAADAATPRSYPAPQYQWQKIGFSIERLIDEEQGIVCYKLQSSTSPSCVKVKQ